MDRIKTAKKILLIPDTRVDLDLMFAADVLFSVLSDNNKEVTLLVDKINYPNFISKIIQNQDVTDKNSFSSDSGYSIKIPDTQISSKGLKWEQEGKDLLITVTTDGSAEISSKNIEFSTMTGYDLTIILGFNNPGKLGDLFMRNKALFSPEKTISIDFSDSPNLTNFGKDDNIALSSIVFSYLLENNFNVDTPSLNKIVAGIYWKTNSLRENINNNKVFPLIKDLLDRGAELNKALELTSNTFKLEEARLLAEILRGMRITKDGVAVSKIGKEISNNVKLKDIIFKDWNLIPYIQGIRLSIVFVEIKNRYVVYIESKDSSINVLDISRAFDGKGTKNRAVIYSSESAEKIESELIKNLTGEKVTYSDNTEETDEDSLDYGSSETGNNFNITSVVTLDDSKPTEPQSKKNKDYEQAALSEVQSDTEREVDNNLTSNDLVRETEGDKIISPNIMNPMPLSPDADEQEELITETDPLQPATELPTPFKFGNEEEEKPKYQGPLPPVEE